jgi:hypothetical protein
VIHRPAVYDLRDPTAVEPIAGRLAAGEPAAFYMGLFTIMQVVSPPHCTGEQGALFWSVKRGRPAWSKLPVFVRPRDALHLVDADAVHPSFRCRTRESFEALWCHGAPMHVVAPLRPGLPFVNPVMVTEPGEAAAAGPDRRTDRRTAALFWMQDPAWCALADALARHLAPRRFLVGSSFNDHGGHPPYTLDELWAHTDARPDLPYRFVVDDPLLAACHGFTSHSLVRLPLVDEEPTLVMLRQGSLSPAWLREKTGLPVRTLPSTTVASRRPGTTDASLRAAFEMLERRRTGSGAR